MKITLLPTTKLGIWSIVLAAGVFVFYSLRRMIMIIGHQRGGETFFSNPLLAIVMILAALSGMAALVIGIFTILKNKERSVTVFLAMLFGLFVTVFWLGEFISPH